VNLDLVVVGLVVFFAVMGALTGGLLQLTHIGAITAAGVLCRPLGVAFGPEAAAHFKTAPVVGVLGVTVVGFFAVYAATQVVARVLIRRVVQNRLLGRADRALGLFLGAGKTVAILFVVLSAMLFFEKPLANVNPALRFDTRGSQVAAWVRANNLFTTFSFPGVKGLGVLARSMHDPAAAAQLGRDPEFAKLQSDPKMKSLLGDSSLQKALLSGDYVAALKDGHVMDILMDPHFRESLGRVGDVDMTTSDEVSEPAPKKRAR
jgi:membrane protein required for colicin V production